MTIRDDKSRSLSSYAAEWPEEGEKLDISAFKARIAAIKSSGDAQHEILGRLAALMMHQRHEDPHCPEKANLMLDEFLEATADPCVAGLWECWSLAEVLAYYWRELGDRALQLVSFFEDHISRSPLEAKGNFDALLRSDSFVPRRIIRAICCHFVFDSGTNLLFDKFVAVAHESLRE